MSEKIRRFIKSCGDLWVVWAALILGFSAFVYGWYVQVSVGIDSARQGSGVSLYGDDCGFRLGYATALFVFFGVAWLMGLRYPDVGWMVVMSGVAAAKVSIIYSLYSPRVVWAGWQDYTYDILNYTEVFAIGAVLMTFLRIETRAPTAARFFLSGVGLVAALRTFLSEDDWCLFGLRHADAPILAALIFVAAGVWGANP